MRSVAISQYLDDLTKNNEHPSDKALLEVKELLLGPLKQLEETNVEIDRLEELVQRLKEKRTKIEQTINRYSCILSPIRRIPQDILHTIFAYCLPDHRNPTMITSESPLLLTRVCSFWRSIVLASPRLWAQIHISFRAEQVYDDYPRYSDIPPEKLAIILQRRCRATREWLSRSGDCPLSISISFSSMYGTGSERPDKSSKLLLETILLVSSRWKALELIVPMAVYCELERMLSTHVLSQLVHFRASIYGPEGPNDYPMLGLLTSPNLQCISVSLPQFSNTELLDPRLIPWHNITHFSLHTYCNIQEFLSVLKYCPQLVHGHFVLRPNEIFESHELISVPFLTSLWISLVDAAQSSLILNNPYNLILAPKLLWIDYRHSHMFSDANLHNNETFSILPLVEKARKLEKLATDRLCLPSSNILKVFEMQNDITYLLLDSTDVYDLLHDHKPFDMKLLVVNADPDATRILLPRLAVFELHGTSESDDTIINFIISRMNPSPFCALLKKVTIAFGRPKDEVGPDIAEEVHKRAREVGITIELNLHYQPPPIAEVQVDPMSPSFMLDYDDGPGDRTWEFRDLEDEDY